MKTLLAATVFVMSALCSLALSAQDSAKPTFSVRVDPRVELLMVVARLARFPEYSRANGKWAYRDAADEWFAPHADHAVVRLMQRLHSQHGVSFDAVPSLAVHLGDLPELAERMPLEPRPERLDQRWAPAETREFLKELRRFAKSAKASDFFAAQRKTWTTAEERLAARLADSKAPEWMRSFYGTPPAGSCVVIPGLLCGPMNFGMGVRFGANKPEELRPVLGCWEFDAQGLPVYGASHLALFAHELCHSYANAVIDGAAAKLDPIGARLFALRADTMRRQAYSNGHTVLYETLVRASVVRCRLATEGREAANAQAQEEVSNGFTWVPALAKELERYEQDRKKWPHMNLFVTDIAACLAAEAQALEDAATKAPHLISITPASGTTNVDPATTELVLVFDRPMKDKTWSFVARKEDLPEFVGSPAFDAERKVLRVKVKMEPNKRYRFQLNSEKFVGFRAEDGTALEGVPVEFSTRR